MANNVQVTQGAGTTFKTTESEGVHVGHVHVDTVPLPTGAATEATLGDLKTAAQALAALIDDAALEVKDGAVAALLTAISGYLAGTLTVSGTVTANTGLSQPLTDTQLRATAVPVSGPLTDAQLRDSPVAVSGPLTDAQLRNSAVPVSVSGAATEAKQDSIVEALGGTLLAQLKTPGGADISAGDVSADGLSTGTVGLTTRSVLYGYNGTSIDRIELENDGSIPVTVKSAISAGSNTIGAVNLAQYTPATGRLPVDGSGVTQPVSHTGLTALVKPLDGDYETVAASQTDQMLGTTGAAGDYLAGVLIIPATTSPGAVSIEDGSTNMPIFAGGADSVSNLVPFFVPLGIFSNSGGWEITTGANVSCFCVGSFT